MKSLARSHVWWPGIDKDIEALAKGCEGCQAVKHSPPAAPIHQWEWPSRPWERIHVDFAEPFLNSMFLVVVDAHSKWPEVVKMKKTTSARTIEVLRTIFARNGIPKQFVSDNGPQFTSEEFRHFTQVNGIKHMTSAPFHPSTNGLAGRFVQSFKMALKSSRDLLSRLDLLKPDVRRTVENKQYNLRARSSKLREFTPGEPVSIRDYRKDKSDRWITGTVLSQTGPVFYQVEVSPGVIWRRHTDQLMSTSVPPYQPESCILPSESFAEPPTQMSSADPPPPMCEPRSTSPSVTPRGQASTSITSSVGHGEKTKTVVPSKVPESRFPKRSTRPPKRYDDYVKY
ncbi:hypothetical protein ScPMuIL_013042 [Solemya velum]